VTSITVSGFLNYRPLVCTKCSNLIYDYTFFVFTG